MYRQIIYLYILILILIGLLGLYFRQILSELPSPETLLDYTPTLSTKIYDVNNELITELFVERRTWVPLKSIPVDLQNAVIAIEDHNFFRHTGISVRGILRAFLNNLRKRKVVSGGSTITQQLAKIAFLTQERTLTRKLKELLLAIILERNFSKQEILEMYLNQVYFGHGAYGVEQASNVFFSKHAYELSLSESALLAGMIRSPGYYSPFNNPKRAIYRRATVLQRMRELGYITDREFSIANSEPINTEKISISTTTAQYFIEYIKLLLESKYGSEKIYNSGWSIYTTLDLNMQNTERVINERLSEFDKLKQNSYNIKQSTYEKVQCALIAMDVKTGEIRAMVGGRNFKESQFNRVIQASRQPGSAFKPIIYTAAIERGYTPSTIIEDTPVVYVNDGRDWHLAAKTTDYLKQLPPEMVKDPMRVWIPENYKKRYYGNVLLRKALEFSLNVCAVRVIEEIGPTTVISYARRLGITSPLVMTYSLALGASDVTLLELVRAYNVFANRGIKVEPYSVIRIEDKNGKIVELNSRKEEEVLSEQTAYIITSLLKGVIQNGTGKYAKKLNRPCAGKTGTTNNYSDAWFIGYTPELICGVWVGYDTKASLGDKMTGGVVACPIWTEFMKNVLEDTPVSDFIVPESGITFVRIDPKTGLLAKNTSYGYEEVFISGTEPKTVGAVTTTTYISVPTEETEGF